MSPAESSTPIGGLGEAGILARLLPILEYGAAGAESSAGPGSAARVELGPGDDAAVLRVPSGRLVATTDALVSDQDFLLTATTGELIGRKAAVQNLADVAAMGARPTALLVSLSAPPQTPIGLLEGIMRGLSARAGREGAAVIGGDLGTAQEIIVSVTALGELEAGQSAVRRCGARPGDALVIGSPRLGRSAAGLAIVLSGRCALHDEGPGRVPRVELVGIRAAGAAQLVLWHDAPDPDLALGWGAGRAAHAMMDVSDGLVRDARRIAAASGVRIDLDRAALAADVEMLAPLAAELGADPWEWVLHGGEEHAMLAALGPESLGPGGEAPAGMRVIGRVGPLAAGARPEVTLDGAPIRGAGWDHFEADAAGEERPRPGSSLQD